jgi:hypothetical protein
VHCAGARADLPGSADGGPPTLLQHYLVHDLKLKRFVPLIKDSIVYPAIYDSNRTLLSLPPIINGAHSAVSQAAA